MKRYQKVFRQFMALGAALFLACGAGCSGKGDKPTADLGEEIAPLPYLPADDGKPLSRNELLAMNYHSGFLTRLSDKDEQEVLLHFKYFTHRGRENFERYLLRAERYLPYVRKVFKEKGVPEDIAYLAIVESGFNPNAVSRAGATGMWQFMPRTGDLYGLQRSWWIDERRDPYKSTVAAAEYLLRLYAEFNDWYLALAAYNAGEGKIGRALTGTGASDFFELCDLNDRLQGKAQLKEETRKYVPKFIAVARIMNNLQRLGFTPLNFSKWEEPEHLKVAGGTNLRGLADAVGISWDEFVDFNPAPQRQSTAPGSNITVHLPKQMLNQAVAYLSSEESRKLAGWTPYTIRKGDTIGKISRRTGVPSKEIIAVNKINPNRLRAGQTILIPGSNVRNVQAAGESRAAGSGRSAAPGGTYKVKSGDTLYKIARAHNTSVKSLCAANNLRENSAIKVGQKLNIPGGAGRTQAAAARADKPAQASRPTADKAKTTYTVRSGDTLWSIARKHKVNPMALLELNRMNRNSKIKVGQKIKIP